MTVILFSLKTMESLQNGVATHFGATALFSIRPVSLASSQHCRSVDADSQKNEPKDSNGGLLFLPCLLPIVCLFGRLQEQIVSVDANEEVRIPSDCLLFRGLWPQAC